MAQTANTVSTGHSLYINQLSSSQQTKLGYQGPKLLDAANLISRTATFFYNDRVRVSFQLTPVYVSFFGLIRGLIEFHRSADISVTYRKDESSFDVDFLLTNGPHVQDFLESIYVVLKKEIGFKNALKSALQFEEEYKKKQQVVYQFITGA